MVWAFSNTIKQFLEPLTFLSIAFTILAAVVIGAYLSHRNNQKMHKVVNTLVEENMKLQTRIVELEKKLEGDEKKSGGEEQT